MSETYVHGTEPSEQERLALLNRMTNETFVSFLGVKPGMRVLEVGSGLGILASHVASIAAEVVGVERSPEQIARAPRLANLTILQGDAHQLEFPDASFDLVYTRYVLEHVADPERVLREMKRVAKSEARVVACENDISLMRVDPPCPTFEIAWDGLARYQQSLGGDALIGRRLFRLFHDAGLREVELSIQSEVHWAGGPGFEAWVRVIIGNIEGIRTHLGVDVADRAVAELEALMERDDASVIFAWNRAAGVKD